MREAMAMCGHEGVASDPMEVMIVQVEGGLNKHTILFFR